MQARRDSGDLWCGAGRITSEKSVDERVRGRSWCPERTIKMEHDHWCMRLVVYQSLYTMQARLLRRAVLLGA